MASQFRKIALIGRIEDARVADSMVAFARHLLKRGMSVRVDAAQPRGGLPAAVEAVAEPALLDDADLAVAIGGDGTMLYAAQLAQGRAVPLLGINRGRLGFLTDVSPTDMLDSFDAILDGRHVTDLRTLLSARLTRPGATPVTSHALNDIVVQKHETGRMIDLETWIDGVYVNTHGGDGLVIASSTGSTAYALSCGGPIIHPALDAIVLAPISPHTLSDRPLVVGRQSIIEVRLRDRPATRAQVTADGRLIGELDAEARLVIEPSSTGLTLLHPPGHDFFRILRSKLHWGRSARNGPEDA